MRQFLFYLAVFGWILGFIFHIFSFADIDLSQYVPVFYFFIGVFVVWIPSVFIMKKNKDFIESQSSLKKRVNPFGFYQTLLKMAPSWLAWIAIAGLIYGFINFFYCLSGAPGVTEVMDNKYVIQNHGQIIKTLTLQEYRHYNSIETRMLSGHLLIFYGMAAAILYPFPKEESDNK
jgi:hypothetical protein